MLFVDEAPLPIRHWSMGLRSDVGSGPRDRQDGRSTSSI